MIAFRFAKQHQAKFIGYGTVVGYCLGLALAVVVTMVFVPQPATIYLFPAVLESILIGAWFYKIPLMTLLYEK